MRKSPPSLEKVVSNNQHDFIKGRRISDVVHIATELLDLELISSVQDFLSGMDSVRRTTTMKNREFLFFVMGKIGFGNRWTHN